MTLQCAALPANTPEIESSITIQSAGFNTMLCTELLNRDLVERVRVGDHPIHIK